MGQIQFIATSPEELANQISNKVEMRLEEFNRNFESKESKEYLSRIQVAEMLGCHISTVDNLCNDKTLTRYQIGGLVRLRKDEVENAIVKLK